MPVGFEESWSGFLRVTGVGRPGDWILSVVIVVILIFLLLRGLKPGLLSIGVDSLTSYSADSSTGRSSRPDEET